MMLVGWPVPVDWWHRASCCVHLGAEQQGAGLAPRGMTTVQHPDHWA